ncbi:metal dependent phosphohydrolase [Chitinispirillum alkaliphilum]|nr:metal dependent phosphohydrolase [Chitinispirillum alkaliphilum]
MNILQRLSEINELPTLPEVVLRIQAMINDDDSNVKMLARIIEQDPALTSKILRIANSSFYSSSQRITSIPLAITRIGFNEVGHIALAITVVKKFSGNSNILDYRQFWRHSLTSAFLNSTIAKVSELDFSNEERQALFLSGLLHDIGILIYDQFFHDEFETIIQYSFDKKMTFLEAEKLIAPYETHAAVGAALLEVWKTNPLVTSGVRFHHMPHKAPVNHKSIVSAANFTEYILCNSGMECFEGFISEGDKNVINHLQITPDSLSEYIKQAEYEVERSELILAMNTTNDIMQLRAI